MLGFSGARDVFATMKLSHWDIYIVEKIIIFVYTWGVQQQMHAYQ